MNLSLRLFLFYRHCNALTRKSLLYNKELKINNNKFQKRPNNTTCNGFLQYTCDDINDDDNIVNIFRRNKENVYIYMTIIYIHHPTAASASLQNRALGTRPPDIRRGPPLSRGLITSYPGSLPKTVVLPCAVGVA